MIAFVYLLSLAIAALGVSILGAAFSVSGLARLFSGAAMSVMLMASALEFSKFVVAAFLHRAWDELNRFYRTYLLVAVIVLSAITSMGIFGYLSDAYQTSSVDLVSNQIKIDALKLEQERNTHEIARMNQAIDEIPASRVSKKIAARKEAEPLVRTLIQQSDQLADQMKQLDLKNLDVKMKVGPLIYVSKAFHQDVDTVVKWLILVFVGVFDPLAICLVIAFSEALKLKSSGVFDSLVKPAPQTAQIIPITQAKEAQAPPPLPAEKIEALAEAQDNLIRMSYADEN